jgi:hypothetical protein
MKHGLWIILLLLVPPLFAKDKKLGGYVLDPTAFRSIQSYCIDTHNLPPDDVKLIDRFVAQESRSKGLLRKLPWHRRVSCQEAGVGAVVRMEFPRDPASTTPTRDEIKGALLVFLPGAPSPIYETPAVTMGDEAPPNVDRDDRFAGSLVAEVMKYGALSSVLRILIHDWWRQ